VETALYQSERSLRDALRRGGVSSASSVEELVELSDLLQSLATEFSLLSGITTEVVNHRILLDADRKFSSLCAALSIVDTEVTALEKSL
jgi:hypothetical protein